MSDHLLNISQAAKKLGVAAVTLRLWERQGKIKSLRTGGNQRRYSSALLESFLESKIKPQIITSEEKPEGEVHTPILLTTLISPFQKQILAWTLAVLTLAGGSAGIYKYSGGNREGVNKVLGWFKNRGFSTNYELSTNNQTTGTVLAAESINDDYRFVVNIPALFNQDITAPNVLYGLVAGDNITVSAGQNPTISSVLPDQFKNFKVGSTTITANSKTDTLELVAGSNVTLSTTDKKITIASAVTDVTTSGITDDGTMVRLTTATDNFGLGAATGAAKLNLNVDDTRDLITASQSGSLKFRLTSGGIIDTGTWNGSVIGPAYGGTGIANNAASTLTISGNYATTLTVTGTTGITLPTTGTLSTLAGTETLTNKTVTSPIVTTSLTTGSTSFALLNTTATTVNFAGAATTLNLGAATGTTTIANAASVSGALTLYGTPTIQSTANQSLTLGGDTTGNISIVDNMVASG
ncbi:MAG: MerR family DNA-binding transcriptional regulator, partial [Patescibacteria group bacterium]